MKANGVKTIKKSEMNWLPSTETLGWEYVLVSGATDSAFSVLCRCPANIDYGPWVSDKLTECFVLNGSIILNGIELQQGEYGSVDPGADGYINTKTAMETVSIMHGKVVFAGEVFDKLRKGPIPPDRAKELSCRPWIDHLRRHATVHHLNAISSWIKTTDDEYLIELCIGVARNLEPSDFIKFVQKVLTGTPGVSLRISAVLYLASKGLMSGSDWTAQEIAMSKDSAELLSVARYFYGAKDNAELEVAIKQRENSGNYEYNQKYYDLLRKFM
ncbi:MAG TPA: hypothetical protein VN374_02750 [Desulfitobacteriaceae bacterium]|nr:hypothetical protein [Desulfitobacteriaceae bacterium]